MSDVKELTDKIEGAVTAMHDMVETERKERAEEKEAWGKATSENKEAYTKANARIDELDAKLQRQTIPRANGEDEATEEQKAERAAFCKFIRHGQAALNPDEYKTLVEDATGGYLITPELDADIVRSLPKITIMRPLVTVRPIGKNSLKMRSVGEVTVGWGKLETGTDPTESETTPGAPTYQYVEDLMGLTKIGRDELMDSDINLITLLGDSFKRALAEAEDLAFVRGAGHASEEPAGICIDLTLIGNTLTTDAANAVTMEKFMDMIYQCPAQYRRNGSFVVNSSLELALRKLRSDTDAGAGTGPFMWEPSLKEGTPNRFLGKGIHTQDDMKELTDAAQVIAIFGDFKAGYRILDRAGMTVQRLGEIYAEAGLVGFLITRRVGGAPMRASQQPLVLLTEHAA